MGGCVLPVRGFVVLEGGHDGVFGWWDCEGVSVFESGGFEHFLAGVEVVQVGLEGKVMVDGLYLVLEVVGRAVLAPAQAIVFVH